MRIKKNWIFAPTATLGLINTILLLIASLVGVSEIAKFASSYLSICKWPTIQAHLIDLEIENSKKIRIKYFYVFEGASYHGNQIGIKKSIWYEASAREINNLKAKKSKEIDIVINPKNPAESTHPIDIDHVYAAAFISLFPIIFLLLLSAELCFSLGSLFFRFIENGKKPSD